MGITSAFSIAASGLRTASLQSSLVASNIANAQTPGYSRKSAELVTRHGSVEVASISRAVDPLLDRLDRANLSQQARAETISSALSTYTAQLGQPDDETSPVAGLARLHSALLTLSTMSDKSAAQMGVISSAEGLVSNLNTLSASLAELGREVELNIRYDVADLNDNLTRLSEINSRLMRSGSLGAEGADLLDEQATLLDQLSSFMDVQLVNGQDGVVSVYTTGGTELLSGKRVSVIAYNSNSNVLTAGNVDITPGKSGSRGFQEGSLSGLFYLRDQAIPQIQEQLDGFANMLVSRFDAADSSLQAGEPGLFMLRSGGGGSAASRLMVNTALDINVGGDPALLLSGLGSGTTLPKGDTTIVLNMMTVFDARDSVSTPLGTGVSLSDYGSAMVSGQQQMRVNAENQLRQAEVSSATIAASRQNLQGVNIDDELQVLMVIEQSFAANSRVLTSLQAMLDDLLNAI